LPLKILRKNMRLIEVNNQVKEKSSYSKRESLNWMRELREEYLRGVYDSKQLTMDMDGVLIHDDNAIMATRTIAGPEAQEIYGKYADLNIKAVSEGETSYCWYAPTLFVGQLLKGLSPEINRVIGSHVRLIPKAREHIDALLEIGYNIIALTAGHQEAAEEVSKRLGIKKTIGTQLGINQGFYDGTVDRFIGGLYKLRAIEEFLDGGTHVGDSWSDVESLKEIPNSIAFNPSCELALRNANISVIGTSLLGLLPLFDHEAKYDSIISHEDMPRIIVVMKDPSNDSVPKILKESRHVKKRELENILNQTDIHTTELGPMIRDKLYKSGIDFQTKVKKFMSLKEFDAYARRAYKQLR
jgi:phosphoserine phosphatase